MERRRERERERERERVDCKEIEINNLVAGNFITRFLFKLLKHLSKLVQTVIYILFSFVFFR